MLAYRHDGEKGLKMANTKDFMQVNTVYLRPEVWRWVKMEAIKHNTPMRDVTSVAVTAYFKWMKKAEIADREKRGLDTKEAKQELDEIQASLDIQAKQILKKK
jgi:hypothetical protein